MITLAGVTVRYHGRTALSGLTERVGAGEWAAIIGPNGAGKSTLLRTVAGLLRHDGDITVDGRPTRGMARRPLARLVAYVPQDPVFPPEMTAADYVLLGRTPHIGFLSMERPADRQVCQGLLARLDLAALADRRLATLSGGERQRLVLARALAQEAAVLLLDEPTSALDLGRRVDALELVDELRRERSLTVMSAVHDLTLAGQFADRLLLLDAGRLAAAGPPGEVLREAVLAPVFGPGVGVLTAPDGDHIVLSRRAGPRRARRANGRPAGSG